MIDKLIKKYDSLLNTLRDNKKTKSKDDLYDYNTDIKNTREYLKDLKALKEQLNIPPLSFSFPTEDEIDCQSYEHDEVDRTDMQNTAYYDGYENGFIEGAKWIEQKLNES